MLRLDTGTSKVSGFRSRGRLIPEFFLLLTRFQSPFSAHVAGFEADPCYRTCQPEVE